VAEDAWPLVRDADELHDALMSFVVIPEDEGRHWSGHFDELGRAGRAAIVTLADGSRFWIAAERWPLVRAVYPGASIHVEPQLPATIANKEWSASEGWVEIVRGHLQFRGPQTATTLAAKLHLEPSHVFAALESLEGSGIAMRGQFDRQELPPLTTHHSPLTDLQWCERRLLARIHRLTLDGLRRRIEPVPPEVYWQYLIEQHHLPRDRQLQGELGLREAIAQLAGFELPAGVWEQKILAPRVADYDPQWLDHLFLSGELVWGRLRPPRRDEEHGPGMAALTRSMPISLALREDLPWLVPDDRPDVSSFASGPSQDVLTALQGRGALFFQDLKAITGLLPSQLEEGLRELAALGLVSSDTFAAVRAIDARGTKTQARLRRFAKMKVHRPASPIGRWSLFPGAIDSVDRQMQLEQWCKLLLARYGVLFRDLLSREPAAPPWWELARVLRRMELRGEVRGGRFIARVGGEQFAVETAVGRLRDLRDSDADKEWTLISAADPLNLSGLIGEGPRIPAMHKNSLVLQDGRCIAAKVAGRIEFLVEIDPAEQMLIRKSLQVGRKVRPATVSAVPEPHVFRKPAKTREPDHTQLNSRRRFGL
jgi:ATP-dependent Lhr-like helicase